ncbi:hypothetical protein [Nonomuraea sp. NPDC049784]|uniref:hypothetical protein n=1 Tax=Nonomuraea sp. NPDC049784 TaxID=3154361 RepID=UPI0033D0F1C6
MPVAATPVYAVPSATSSPRSTHERIQQAYTEYWAVLLRAGRSTPEQARELLKPYVAGGYLEQLVEGVRRMRDKGREPSGRVTPRVKEVWLAGRHAKVVDCQDVSHAYLVDVRTGQIVAKDEPIQTFANVEAALRQGEDGRWRLESVRIKDKPCTPLNPPDAMETSPQ